MAQVTAATAAMSGEDRTCSAQTHVNSYSFNIFNKDQYKKWDLVMRIRAQARLRLRLRLVYYGNATGCGECRPGTPGGLTFILESRSIWPGAEARELLSDCPHDHSLV